ncbi:MAG: c-type cytochrome, partial [Candidatus Tectimicrobiota bacterium]
QGRPVRLIQPIDAALEGPTDAVLRGQHPMEMHHTSLSRSTMSLLTVLVAAVAGLTLTTSAVRAVKGNPEAGKKTYEQFCLPCHGATGKGDGPTGQYLTPKPADYSTSLPEHGDQWADYYFKIIKEGGVAMDPPRSPLMAPWGGQLSDDEIWDVVSYIETLAKGGQ